MFKAKKMFEARKPMNEANAACTIMRVDMGAGAAASAIERSMGSDCTASMVRQVPSYSPFSLEKEIRVTREMYDWDHDMIVSRCMVTGEKRMEIVPIHEGAPGTFRYAR